jgi:glutathione S-transferase
MPELLGLPYSPWSEKARWALEARGVPYVKRLYSPLLGELGLRVKLRKWTGKVTVPVFTCDDGTVLSDSTDIARWADARGDGPTMFPAAHEAAIAKLVALSDRGLAAGRALSLLRLLDDRDGVIEMVPRNLRKVPGTKSIARAGLRRTLRKYGSELDRTVAQAELASVLEELRAALAAAPPGSPKTLLGTFTFADVAMSQVLAFIDPPAFGLKLGQATRKSFIDDELRTRFADLVTWRDELYAKYRPQS